MKKFPLVALLAVVVTLSFVRCSKDDDGGPAGSHRVVFKAVASENAQISTVVYTNESGDPTTVTGVDASTWTSEELTFPAATPLIAIGVNGSTTDDKSGELTVQIIVDGEVVKENTSTGPILSAQTSFEFK